MQKKQQQQQQQQKIISLFDLNTILPTIYLEHVYEP